MFKTIEEALDWIVQQRKNDAAFSHFKEVMEELANPQDAFKVVHVTGTNGKGSTIAFLRDLLIAHGFKVGTLQSPHYLTHLDRIRINGNPIPGDIFLEILNQYYDFFRAENLNMFEMDYIIMCEYFKREKLDYVLTEVGIGGRLDSTNVISKPLLSVIVSISYDHTERLGQRLEEITYEKCGIIKETCPLVIGDIADNLVHIIQAEAEIKKAKLFRLQRYIDLSKQHFKYRGIKYSLISEANYQKHNAALALEVFYQLAQIEKIEMDFALMQKAIANSIWQGRFERLSDEPIVIIDGAHNLSGCDALVESLDQIEAKKAILFSALKRKEYKKMLETLKKHCDRLVVSQFDHPQVISEEMVEGYEFHQHFDLAFEDLCRQYECVVVCGSLYFVSAFMEYYRKRV